MVKYYAKQVSPEWQEDDLFYQYKDKKTGHYNLGMNDDYYVDDVIIFGNKEFKDYTNEEFDKIRQLDNVYYEFENNYWNNASEFVHAYFGRKNGKRYGTREIHAWKELFKKYEQRYDIDDVITDALKLMTGKSWRTREIHGYMQREWQTIYVSENVSEESVDYIGMCYFNTGTEWLVYESKEDFDNEESSYSIYCEDEEDLVDRIGCEREDIEIYEFVDYVKIPQYKLV